MARPFRFGVQTGPFDDAVALRDFARMVETLGYDELFSFDHIGAVDPFLPLMVAAEATTRLRFGPLVINNELHNPALLARTAATFDALSNGRHNPRGRAVEAAAPVDNRNGAVSHKGLGKRSAFPTAPTAPSSGLHI